MPTSNLLTIDAIVNMGLGLLLLTFPDAIVEALGVPPAANAFYPNILGGVLFGIGLALWLGRSGSATGLGFGGAVSINLCGGAVLGLWLLFGDLQIPARGRVLLWGLVVLLVGLSVLEIIAQQRSKHRSGVG